MVDSVDFVSAISLAIAIFIGTVTLLTVYIGAMQLLSQNRVYRTGLSWRSIGPWQKIMAHSRLLGLQRRVSVPTLSMKHLVQTAWQPDITFPVGLAKSETDNIEVAEEYMQAKASWVNFMQAIGLSPTDQTHYEMQDTTDFVNGIVPMRWRGQDLARICSILGFHSFEKRPNFQSPMTLPMQWSGPLGWLQFQTSAIGCIVEFRRRMVLPTQISKTLHNFSWPESCCVRSKPDVLRSRLWNSINGFALPNGKALYLGGVDKRDKNDETSLLINTGNDPRCFLDDEMDTSDKKQVLCPCPGLLTANIHGELAHNRGLNMKDSYEYGRQCMNGGDIDHTQYPYNLGNLYMDGDLLKLMKKALLQLQPDGFYFSPASNISHDIKQAYQHVEDVSSGLREIFPRWLNMSLEGHCNMSKHTLPIHPQQEHNKPWLMGDRTASSLSVTLPSYTSSPQSNPTQTTPGICPLRPEGTRDICQTRTICAAMDLCNNLQKVHKTPSSCFTIEDTKLSAKASSALLDILSSPSCPNGQDLIWALLYCRELLPWLLNGFGNIHDFHMNNLALVHIVNNGNKLTCTALLGPHGPDVEFLAQYESQLVANTSFTGPQILAAMAYVFIAHYWMEEKWLSNVAAYDIAMPQTVFMR